MNKLFLLSLPLVVLLAYAGIVKGMDVGLFQTQLAQSPLIPSAAIVFISYSIPIAEVAIAIGFFSERYFKWAAYAALALMAFFSLYLIALVALFPSESIPCSCGGILGKMSYPVHIVFNVAFTALAAYLCIQVEKASKNYKQNELYA